MCVHTLNELYKKQIDYIDLVEICLVLPGAPQGCRRGPNVSGTLGPLEVVEAQGGPVACEGTIMRYDNVSAQLPSLDNYLQGHIWLQTCATPHLP